MAWARAQAAHGGWGIHKYSWTEGCDSCLGTHPTSQRSGWEMFLHLAHGWVFRHGIGDLQPHLNQVSFSGFQVSHFRKGLEKWEADPIGKLGLWSQPFGLQFQAEIWVHAQDTTHRGLKDSEHEVKSLSSFGQNAVMGLFSDLIWLLGSKAWGLARAVCGGGYEVQRVD